MDGGSLRSAPSPGRHLRAELTSSPHQAIHTAGEHHSLQITTRTLHLHNQNHWKTTSFSQSGRFLPSHEDGRVWDGPVDPVPCVSSVTWGRTLMQFLQNKEWKLPPVNAFHGDHKVENMGLFEGSCLGEISTSPSLNWMHVG